MRCGRAATGGVEACVRKPVGARLDGVVLAGEAVDPIDARLDGELAPSVARPPGAGTLIVARWAPAVCVRTAQPMMSPELPHAEVPGPAAMNLSMRMALPVGMAI